MAMPRSYNPHIVWQLDAIALGDDPFVLAYLREDCDDSILVLLNMSEQKSLFRGEIFERLNQKIWKLLASTHSNIAENFSSLKFNLKPFEGLVLKSR